MSSTWNDHSLLGFREFTLDLNRGALRKNGEDVVLRPQSFKVLQILVENHGCLVEKKRLQLEVWGNVAVTDDSLTHCLIDIRKAIGDSERTMIRTVPRRGYLFDLTVTEIDDRNSHPIFSRTSPAGLPKRAAMMIAVVSIILVGFWIGSDRGIHMEDIAKAARSPQANSIAVLPFVDLSIKQEQRFYGEAMSEEILNRLAQISALHVIARTSSFTFRNGDSDIATIARQLNVAYILEGSIRNAGDRVRITAQLIETQDESHVWSQTYDRDSQNALDVQAEVAAAVASALRVSLVKSHSAKIPTDPLTFGLFARARYLLHQRDASVKPEAVALLEEVVERDPEFVRGFTELARAYNQQAQIGQRSFKRGERTANELTQHALEMDPDDAVANAWQGWYEFFTNNDLAAAVWRFDRALVAAPENLDILRPATVLITAVGRIDEAVELAEYVMAHDPLCEICRTNLIHTYRIAERYGDSEEQIRLVLAMYPERVDMYVPLAYALLLQGDADGAMAALEWAEGDADDGLAALNKDQRLGPSRLVCEAIALHRLGRSNEFDIKIRELRHEWSDTRPASVAQVYAAIGDADSAFFWLKKWSEAEPINFRGYRSPLYKPIRDDPRWNQLLATIGLSDQQLATLDFRFTVPL